MAELSNLGRYELRRVLGKGAMGVVYEGFDPTLNRSVAVKTILKSVVTDEESAASYSARFVREAKAVARLSHPNIVQVYDFGEENDVAYLVMEFIQGRELRSCFEANESFDAAEAVRIMGELLDALEFAHEAGVIHRDVKPANVMLDARRRVKLADFGVARIQDGTDRSKGGTMVGTPAFMSPEQISGRKVDRRTDLFSAGIILYQLLTGEQPFKGEGAWTVAKQIMQDEPPRPSTIAGKISPAFDQIVNKALAKKPEHRFASAKEFAAAMQGALSGDPSRKDSSGSRASDAEVEFWRSIQNSSDPAEFEVYLKEFPTGIYADLARIKMAKLPRIAPGAGSVTPAPAPPLPARDTAELSKLAEETVRLKAELAQREAEYRKRAAEAEARRQTEEKARAEADAKREAEATARAAAEENARLAALEKAKQETLAELAKREAEYKKREADALAKAQAEAKTRRETEEKAKREAEVRAKVEGEARARREADEKARRETEAKARAVAEAKAKREAEESARHQAEIQRREAEIQRSEAELKRRAAQTPRSKAPIVQIGIAFLVVVVGAFGTWYWSTSSDEARLAAVTAAFEAATKATQELNLARQRQEELRRQVEVARLAEDDARAKGDQAKLKELQELTKKAEAEAQKQNELVKQREAEARKADDVAKVADAKKQTEASKAAEKAAQEKLAAEKLAQEKAATEKVAQEKAAADKAATEKLAAEKAAADKVAVEKAAAAKSDAARSAATAGRAGWPNVGDRWVYEARDANHPEKKYPITVKVLAVTASSVRDVIKAGDGAEFEREQKAVPALNYGGQPGITEFLPYLRAFQEIRVGESWAKVNAADMFPNCTSGEYSCTASARIAGREQVSVKAGTFDAWKVEVQMTTMNTMRGMIEPLTATYWYAEEVRRFVKYEFRCRRCIINTDMNSELVSYSPAGAR